MPPLLIINKDPKNKNKTYDGLIPIFFDIISSHYNIRWIKKYIAILAYLFINPTRQFNFQIPIYSCDLHSRWRTQPKYYRPIWKKRTFVKYLKHAYLRFELAYCVLYRKSIGKQYRWYQMYNNWILSMYLYLSEFLHLL